MRKLEQQRNSSAACTAWNMLTMLAVLGVLFSKPGKPEAVPPTSNALQFHIMRAHYQSIETSPHLNPSTSRNGMKAAMGKFGLETILMTTDPITKPTFKQLSDNC